MRTAISILMAFVLMLSTAFAAPGEYDKQKCKSDKHEYKYKYNYDYDYDCDYDIDHWGHYSWRDNNTRLDIDDGSVIITHDGWRDDEIEISRSGDLRINGNSITVSDNQRRLLKKYNETAIDMVDRAEELGEIGAKIGVQGAKLGLTAASNTLKLLFSGFDTDELERELEEEAEKLEIEAEALEEQAEVVEDMADELEDIADELQDEIDELRGLRWF